MHYFIFPDIDTTLYQASGSMNVGLDEILEVQKRFSLRTQIQSFLEF